MSSNSHFKEHSQIMNKTKLSAVFGTLIFLNVSALADSNTHPANSKASANTGFEYQVLLAGGGLATCSSMVQKNCHDLSFSQNAKTETVYSITPEKIKKLTDAEIFRKQSDSIKLKLNTVFSHFYANPVSETTNLRRTFESAEVKHNGESFNAGDYFNNLPNTIYYAIGDYFEIQDTRIEEVDLAQNKSDKVVEIYTSFVKSARHKRDNEDKSTPVKIGVMTSSSRDPFSVSDFYKGVFEKAAQQVLEPGDFEVVWIPLDKSLNEAIRMQAQGFNGCERLNEVRADNQTFNRDFAYPQFHQLQTTVCDNPEKLTEMVSSLHGLFINGGDQSLTRGALTQPDGQPNQWLDIIHRKLAANTLVIGGTSAGTAVQGGGIFENRQVPMVSSGDSEVAFLRGAFPLPPPPFGCEKDQSCLYGLIEDDLTYNPMGGIGTFDLGITDTHFSERDREPRLALLALATKTRFGFGVDEATALAVYTSGKGNKHMHVIGEGGVFIVDTDAAIYKSQAGKNQIVALSHFINDGDKANYIADERQLNIVFGATSELLSESTRLVPVHKGTWRRQVASQCGSKTFHRWHDMKIAFVVNPTGETQYAANNSSQFPTCSYSNLIFGMEN